MTTKAELAKENEKTRRVKEEDEALKEKAKEAVHDAKKGVKDLAHKTEDMDLKDAPEKLLPSVERIDKKLEEAEQKVADARTAHVGEKDLARYPKIQQVMKDAQTILADNRAVLKDKTEDGTLSETVQHTADLAQLLKDQSFVTLDKLWTNWAALLTAVAGSSAGSWKQILQESGHLLSQLHHTQDFIKLLVDLQSTITAISARATKQEAFGDKLDKINAEWEKQRDQLLEDWKRIWGVLNQSPVWKQLVSKGKALKEVAAKAGQETKEELEKRGDKVADSTEVSKLKQDFKNVLQLLVGKDGPDVSAFLDYCADAYSDIVDNDDFSRWASEMVDLFESMDKQNSGEAYEKQMTQMYDHTKDLLDNTVNNRNLKLAFRESRKLLKSAKTDPNTKKLLNDARKLLKDVGDKKGVNYLDPQLLGEIRAVIVPLLMDHLDNTPLPDYHGRDANGTGKYDYTLSGIRMGTTGLVPSKVKVEFRYKAEANPSQLKMERQQMLMYLEASDIQVSLKDVKWQYHRNTIPRFSDNGTVDLATAGKGITLRLKAQMHDFQAPTHASSFSELLSDPKEHKMFTVLKSECTIDDFHVRVSDAGGANVFYEMIAGILGTKIKHQVEAMVEQKMDLLCNKFDKTLYDIVRRATQPSLAEETKDALLAVGEKIKDTAADAKSSLQSM